MNRIISELRLYLANRWVSCIPSHTLRLFFYRKIMKFEIGKNSSIFMDCTFDCAGNVTIGEHSVINNKCRIDPRGGIQIGNNVSVSSDVIILTSDHDMSNNMAGRDRKVTIQDYAWIGTRAMIMPGVTLGKACIIAAGSIVTKNVVDFTVVAGVPAKAIKMRPYQEEFNFNVSYKRLFQ